MLSAVTIVTHGFASNADTWVDAMADAMVTRIAAETPFAESDVAKYELTVGSSSVQLTQESSQSYLTAASGETVVRLDWGADSSSLGLSTLATAVRIADFLFASESWMVEGALHLLGHSRGASLVTALAAELGVRGVWVDQTTLLDAHPVDVDYPMELPENVVFADGYWREGGGALSFDGEHISGAFNTKLNQDHFAGDSVGYGGFSDVHSDVHLWYHGTIDNAGGFSDAVNGVGETVAAEDAGYWYSPDAYDAVDGNVSSGRNDIGYAYSRVVGNARPDSGMAQSLGGQGQRASIDWINAVWPNLLDFTVDTTDVEFAIGESIPVSYSYQDADSDASVEFYLDVDKNPYNGNATMVGPSFVLSGGTPSLMLDSKDLPTAGLAPALYSVSARIVDASGRARWAYAPGTIDLVDVGMVIDNGDAGYTSTGFHPIPDGTFITPEGRDGDIENSGKGTGADVATWTFAGLTAGTYRVSATWSTHENRATNAPYSIFDDATGDLLVRTLINQELEPGDFTADGSAWQDLGIVTISGDALTVQLSDDADQYVIADAVRIEAFSEAVPPGATFIDDGDPGYTDSGWHVSPLLEGRLNDIRYRQAGDGSQTARWTFTGLTPGNYTVAATWSAHANRATDAPFTILDGGGGDTLEIVRVNQQMAPQDFSDNGSGWGHLGVVAITGSELIVELSNDANGYVIADAVRIEAARIDPQPPGTIIDDGDAGFSTSAGWTPTPIIEGRDGDIQFAGLGDGSRIATWTFTVTPGTYRVSATWPAHANRATNAPYSILDGANPVGTVVVNQRVAPDDFRTLDSAWEDLTTVDVTGDTLVVELSNNANGFVIADAIRIEPQPVVEPS